MGKVANIIYFELDWNIILLFLIIMIQQYQIRKIKKKIIYNDKEIKMWDCNHSLEEKAN
jgi:hypothetical protein